MKSLIFIKYLESQCHRGHPLSAPLFYRNSIFRKLFEIFVYEGIEFATDAATNYYRLNGSAHLLSYHCEDHRFKMSLAKANVKVLAGLLSFWSQQERVHRPVSDCF